MFDHIFAVNPFNSTRVFMTLYLGLLAIILLVSYPSHLAYLRSRRKTFGPLLILAYFRPPKLEAPGFSLVAMGLIAGLVLAAMGIAIRPALILALICFFLYFSQIHDMPEIRVKPNTLSLVLCILLVSPGLDAGYHEPTPHWPLIAVQLLITQIYVSAGIQKLKTSGLSWAEGSTLQAYLIQHHLWGGFKLAWHIAQFPLLCRLLSISTLIFELFFFLILIFPDTIPFFAVSGLLFHLGTSLSMGIHYLKFFGPVYIVFATPFIYRMVWPMIG